MQTLQILVARALRLLRFNAISEREVRAEAWALGGRHQGRVGDGARLELAVAGLSPRRAALLHAVIHSAHGKD